MCDGEQLTRLEAKIEQLETSLFCSRGVTELQSAAAASERQEVERLQGICKRAAIKVRRARARLEQHERFDWDLGQMLDTALGELAKASDG